MEKISTLLHFLIIARFSPDCKRRGREKEKRKCGGAFLKKAHPRTPLKNFFPPKNDRRLPIFRSAVSKIFIKVFERGAGREQLLRCPKKAGMVNHACFSSTAATPHAPCFRHRRRSHSSLFPKSSPRKSFYKLSKIFVPFVFSQWRERAARAKKVTATPAK